ncbi:MAG: hypothetical protein AB7Q45_20310, partial [Planctomycetaceae bacterium]
MRDAKSDEERTALREEMQRSFQERQRQADEGLKTVLTEQQLTRLQQVSLRQQGLRALGDAELADSLGFSDDQKQKIAALLEERDAARRELSRDISDEDREK